MGKIRVATLGDEQAEKEQKRKAEARRQTKEAKKAKVDESETSVVGSEAPVEEKTSDAKTKKKSETKSKSRSKKYVEMASLVDKEKIYSISEAISLVKRTSMTTFDGTVELHINMNPQTLGDKKDLRGSVTLPHGTGKQVKVVIADEALIAEIESGKINFDILVAHPSMMPKLAKVAKVLGPKGLMPNPKNGTVSPDPEKRVKELSNGQINFKTEPDNPIVHMIVGKVSFDDNKLVENVKAVFSAIGTSKIVRTTMTATMGPGVKVATA
jgi:large subunit ribosomal protein L1